MSATATYKPGDVVNYETDDGKLKEGTFLRNGKGGVCEIETTGKMKIGRPSGKVFPRETAIDSKSADVDAKIAKKFDPAATPPLPFPKPTIAEASTNDLKHAAEYLGISPDSPRRELVEDLRKIEHECRREGTIAENETLADSIPPAECKPAKKPRKKKTAKSAKGKPPAQADPVYFSAPTTSETHSTQVISRTIRIDEQVEPEGVRADIHFGDCIAGMESKLADNSVHLTVTSIPFEELFTYSGKPEDVGNNGSTIDLREGRFALNLRFVIAQLLRVTAPGCNVCIHIQQLLAYKNQHGFAGRRDFRGAVIDLFRAAGFLFFGEVAIPKNPQAMAQRLSLHSLQFATGYRRTSTNWAPAPNDFVLIFQKPGEVANPVRPLVYRDNSFAVVHGASEFTINRALLPTLREAFYAAEKKSPLLYAKHLNEWATATLEKNPKLEINPLGWMVPEDWVKWASGVWGDIDEFDIIDGARSGRDEGDEKHVCPLQLELIRRLVLLYSNPITIQPDVLVLDPFMGVGSTAAVCIETDRNVVGFELKESYHRVGLKNVERTRKDRIVAVETAPMLPYAESQEELTEAA